MQRRDESGRFLGTVYLIHFSLPYRHAKHYTGWTTDIEYRISEHRRSRGSRLLAVVNLFGIHWEISRIWLEVPRSKERRVKHTSKHKVCLLCKLEDRYGLPVTADETGDESTLAKEAR